MQHVVIIVIIAMLTCVHFGCHMRDIRDVGV